MNIVFQNIIPNPMREESFTSESSWGKQLELNSSTHYFVTSASGKGKSTFISYILGLRNDYSGNLLFDGKDVTLFSPNEWAELRRNKLAFLPQDLKLFPHLTVLENLLLKNQLTDHKSEQEIIEMLETFSLDHKKDQLAGKLSLGQQQRVALIRTLLQPFEFLLLDEPFSNIDEANIEIAKKMILEECDQNNGRFIIATLDYNYGLTNVQSIRL